MAEKKLTPMIDNDGSLENKILSQLNFSELYSSEVENFSDNGGEVLGQADCPFCSDGDGSLNVNLKDGHFICFCCSAGGSVTDFLMKKFGADIETVLVFCVEFAGRDKKEEKEESGTQNPGPEKQSEGIFLKPEIYKSDAFLSLGKNAIKILIALMAHNQTEISDDIKLSYGIIEEKYKIGRSSIPKAISQLHEKGFINIIHRGGGGQRDKNVYRLVDDYRI